MKSFTELDILHLISGTSRGEVSPPCPDVVEQMLGYKQCLLFSV
jgi:hypothetical protein